MIRDIVRTVCVIVTLAVASSLVIETRFQLVCIEMATRPQPVAMFAAAPAPPPPGRLRSLGRAAVDLADAALGVVR